MSKLKKPDEVEIGKTYSIHDGFGEGKIGVCVERRESGFGHVWGEIKPNDEEEGHWVRWQQLSHA